MKLFKSMGFRAVVAFLVKYLFCLFGAMVVGTTMLPMYEKLEDWVSKGE